MNQNTAFLSDEVTPSLQTTAQFHRAVDALRQGKTYCAGALREYFDTYAENLERFRIAKDEEEFDEKVVRSIEEFLPYRNEAIELLLAIARYQGTDDSWETLHHFFEKLVPYLDRPESVINWQESDFDNFKFIVNELFVYAIASLLKYERFAGVAYLLRQHYYSSENAKRGRDAMVPFSEFSDHLRSLAYRNDRLKLRRLSLHADLLEQRSKVSGLSFQQVMQADFILFIRDCMDCLRTEGRWQNWWPVTLLYASRQYGAFEVFARSQSRQYFDRMKCVLDIGTKDDLLPLGTAFKEQKLRIPSWDFHSVNLSELMAFDKLSTLP